MGWTALIPSSEAYRRASGRRAYNALRRDLKIFRRHDVAELLMKYGFKRGVQAKIAKVLGFSESVISRDLKCLMEGKRVCQCCGSVLPREFRFMEAADLPPI